MIGFLLLLQVPDLNDTKAISELALNIDKTNDNATYLCEKTLWKMRQLVIENELVPLLFEKTAQTLAESFQINLELQRIDSVLIESNMSSLGRIVVFSKIIYNFLMIFQRHHSDLLAKLPCPPSL